MKRALPLALLLWAATIAPAWCCTNNPGKPCGALPDNPPNGNGTGNGNNNNTGGGGTGRGGSGNNNSGGSGTIGDGSSGQQIGGPGSTPGAQPGTSSMFGENPGGQLNQQQIQQCLSNPSCASALRGLGCDVNPNGPGCSSTSDGASGAAAPAAPGGGDAQAQKQAIATAQANGAAVAGANANWSPTDMAKLRGTPSDGGLTSDQRTTMLASMLGQRAAGAAADNFGKGMVKDLSQPGQAGLLTPQQRALELLGSAANKLKLGDAVGALHDALKAIELDPSNAAGYLKAAEAYNHLGRFEDAEKMAREAITRDPNNAQAWKNLAWALLKQGKYKEALEAALMATKLKPDMAEAWAIAAFAAEKLGDLKARNGYLERATAFDQRFQKRLENAKAGGSAYDDDDNLVGDASAKKTSQLPWAWLAFVAAALSVAAMTVSLWRRRARHTVPSAKTVVQLLPPTPSAPRAPRMEAPSGAGVVVGKYELGQLIGRGGMGEVYEAKDLSLGRLVAIKKMTEGFSELGSQARGLFLKEARTVAQLHHPAIVDIYEILEQGADLYLVFEMVKGKTAQQLLAESGHMPLSRASEIMKPVCDALQFAHGRSMVHRDLKPANIMLTEQGHVKLMDFGIARSLRDAVETQLGSRALSTQTALAVGSARTATVVGTPVYMAPEAELGVVCKEGDVYSLGVTLYELLTGRLPFSSQGMAQEKATLGFAKATTIARDLPAAVDDLIEKALQPQVEHRLKAPSEFLALLAAAR